jgi:hypothetical protein
MHRPESASVGIIPIGALGVAFHHHLTLGRPPSAQDVVFLSRHSGSQGERWREDMSVRIEVPSGFHDLRLAGMLGGSLPEAAAVGRLPGIILVCTNPDQLFDVVADFVAVIEHENRVNGLAAAAARLPLLVLCANGIYFQRIRSSFIELLEESTLLGRLPDLWPDLMPVVVGRLMRGITIQTALRRGSGTSAVYRPGPPGRTQLAGGDRAARATAARQLTQLGGWFEDAGDVSATRAEFNKALVNLAMNVLGLLAAIGEDGSFSPLTVGEIKQRVPPWRILGLVEAVTLVGRGVGVFGAKESAADVLAELQRALEPASAHVPSSLQLLQQHIASGTLGPGLAPTETWLLEPLKHYARSLSDTRALSYFEALEAELTAALARAAAANRYQGQSPSVPGPA